MQLTLDELVSITGGALLASGETEGQKIFTGVGALDEAGSDEISFLGNEKYFQDFLSTEAGAVLVPPGLPDQPSASILIEIEDPSLAFNAVVQRLVASNRKFAPGIHPSAHVSDDAQLDAAKVCVRAGAVIEAGASVGNGTEIGPGVVVCADSVIGENCVLHANATVRERCVLGNHVILQPGAVIGSDGYGYTLVEGRHEPIDQAGIVELEDYVDIGANTTIDRARFGKTLIGEGTKVDNLVQIAHNVRIGKHCLIVAQCGLAGSSQVGEYVTFAAQSGTAGHVKINDRATLAARAGALKDLPGDMVYMGMPARPVRAEQRRMALQARLPKLVAQVKELQRRLDELGESSD